MTDMLRGRIYRARLTHIGEDKFFLVISNNRRNRAFEQVLATRLTTTPPKAERARAGSASVPKRSHGPAGSLVTTIETIYDDEVRADVGAVTASAMRRVEAGLRAALGMAG